MTKAISGSQKKFAVFLVLTLAGALTAGCGTGSIFGSGGGGGGSTPTATQTAEPTSKPAVPEPAETTSKEPVVIYSPSTQTPDPAESSKPASEPEAEPQDFVGEIELSVEGRPGVQVFYFAATECEISPELVQVTGQGIDLSTGEPSKVVIRSQPFEAMRYPVFQAAGSITVTAADEEYVADGRMEIIEGYSLPSMFMYNLEDYGIKYAVSWWAGASRASAGYVKVSCND